MSERLTDSALEQAISDLANLTGIEYELRRRAAAASLHIRRSALDRLVEEKHWPLQYLKGSDISGCFLCDRKRYPMTFFPVTIGQCSPVFLVCLGCLNGKNVEKRVAKKFKERQAREEEQADGPTNLT